MYNFNKYHSILVKNFTMAIQERGDIQAQFGTYGKEYKENVMIFNNFCDHTKNLFLIKAVIFSMENNAIFNYFATIIYYDKKEVLLVYSADHTGRNIETSFEITRDFKERVSQMKKLKLKSRLLPELEALKTAIEERP